MNCPLCNGPCNSQPKPDAIVTAVCEQHGIDVVVLRSRCRKKQLVDARRAAAVALRRAGLSKEAIGDYIARDRTSVCHLLKGAQAVQQSSTVVTGGES